MKVFLTGGTGFIGQATARALLRRGWQVIALVRDPASRAAKALQAAGARPVKGDVTRPESMAAGMPGADIVIHNAGRYEYGLTQSQKAEMRAANVEGTENTLGLAAELGIPRIVYTSTALAFGVVDETSVIDESFTRRTAPLTYYEQTKSEAHEIAVRFQQQGAPLVIVCPSQVVGPGDTSPWGYFARLYVRGWMPPAGWAPDAFHTHTHVDDIAEAIALAAEKGRPGQTYILAGEARRMREILAIWSRTPGGLKPRFWLPRPLALLNGAMAEPLLRLLGQPAFFSRESVRASHANYRYSTAKAGQELGARFRGMEQLWQETLAAERARAKK